MATVKIIKDTIHANGIDISVYSEDLQNDYISLTDIAKKREGEYPGYVIQNWLRNKSTVAFVGLWELIHNPNFNCVEFEAIKNESGLNRFASWISPEFKLYIIEDYQRLKEGENARLSLNWNLNREISKLNYRIHTDGIKENLLPPELTPAQISFTYANEADMLNVVLLSRRKADDCVEVELELDELDVTSAESQATYVENKDYAGRGEARVMPVSKYFISG
ncbi:KilA-N domain-containing protein [Sporofaciens sp. SGI.106]|uniref:KilA-N domain-containing protein n=1 Tax=Sporofaciens sp. SGI.106 TaxID=3420568 RepID=UPI002A996965|nr:KilA-N domain-containing protein [Lachnoclostridium sp.]